MFHDLALTVLQEYYSINIFLTPIRHFINIQNLIYLQTCMRNLTLYSSSNTIIWAFAMRCCEEVPLTWYAMIFFMMVRFAKFL